MRYQSTQKHVSRICVVRLFLLSLFQRKRKSKHVNEMGKGIEVYTEMKNFVWFPISCIWRHDQTITYWII